MGKSLEQVLSNILVSNPDAVVVLNQLAREYATRNFVSVNNMEASCTENDMFYINAYEISKLKNYLDIDGYYKIDIEFTDGRNLILEYYEPVKMQSDYDKLFYWFERRDGEDDYDDDTDIEDSDSDGSETNNSGSNNQNPGTDTDEDDDTQQPIDVHYELTAFKQNASISLQKPPIDAEYLLYASTYPEIQYFTQGEVMLYEDTMTIGWPRGEKIYGNIFYLLQTDPYSSPQEYYLIEAITLHATPDEAIAEYHRYPEFSVKTFQVKIDGYPTTIGMFYLNEDFIYGS